jgi:sugar phosphate isomerase/epimerase
MILAGFADEAASSLEGQIAATKALGWHAIELRSLDGKNIGDIPIAEADGVRQTLDRHHIRICALGSTIANWGESIDSPHAPTLEKTKRVIAWMRRLDTRLVRIMSYAVRMGTGNEVHPDQKEEERFRRLREICSLFLDAGMTPVHENCHTYGGMSWEHTLQLLEEVPGLKLVFDTGNPPLTPDFRRPYPYPMQDSWDFYQQIKTHIAHVHIKDALTGAPGGQETYTFPGEGDGKVLEIVTDLLKNGYNGAFSIEPHMAVVFHDSAVESSEHVRFGNYVEYGERFQELLEKAKLAAGMEPKL